MKLYQIAYKFADHFNVLDPNTLYIGKKKALAVLQNTANRIVVGRYVLLEYCPFRVYELSKTGKSLVDITTKKEKV